MREHVAKKHVLAAGHLGGDDREGGDRTATR